MEREGRFMKLISILVLMLDFYQTVVTGTCASNTCDYIVVGAGTAGCVVANRLSADPNNCVFLIEVGERPNLLSEVPHFQYYMHFSKYDWNYTVQMPSFPEFKIHIPNKPLLQGKAIGGSSVVDELLYIRGNKEDYNDWARSGAVGWDWNNVFPFFKKSENNRDEDIFKNGYHGRDGEMFVQRSKFRTVLANKYLEAATELGYKLGDINGPTQEVFMIPQLMVHKGRRWDSHEAFLYPIKGRRNFKLLASTFVRKLLFNGTRTIGVEIDNNGNISTILAKKEVILSAGPINSPRLLMVSGIGPKKELEMLGINVISDLPVGKNFHDRPYVIAYFKSINESIPGLSISETEYNKFLISGTGILSDVVAEAIGFVSSNISSRPDIELFHITFIQPKSFFSNPNDTTALCGCVAELSRPRSRGEITLKSSDLYEYPQINPNYFSKDKDVKAMMEGVQKCRAFEDANALKGILAKNEMKPIPECEHLAPKSTKRLECETKASVSPGSIIGGSCKMGDIKDASSVVDPNLRVIGVEGLRVVDNSIMPTAVGSHTRAIAAMIAEKGAEIILREH